MQLKFLILVIEAKKLENIFWSLSQTDSRRFIKSLPKINTEVPMIIELPIPPMHWAKIAAKQPSPPPTTVPIPRLKPFPKVAPDTLINLVHV